MPINIDIYTGHIFAFCKHNIFFSYLFYDFINLYKMK